MSAGIIGFSGDTVRDTKARGKAALERLFSPEFRNRLDAIVSFKPLSFEVMETIVDKFIEELEAQLRERKVAIELSPEARATSPRRATTRSSGSAAQPLDSNRSAQPADRRDPVRPARARRHGEDRRGRGRRADLHPYAVPPDAAREGSPPKPETLGRVPDTALV
jgi:hypothetical protein